MKKSLLFASALSLVMLAGCTKEQPTGNGQGSESKLDISGSIITPDTKIQIGEPADNKAPILWNNGDEIALFAANADNIVPAMTFEGKRTSYSGAATATTTTPSSHTYFEFKFMDDITADLSGGEYTMYGVYGMGYLTIGGEDTDITSYFSLPDFSTQTFDPQNPSALPLFLIGSTPVEGESINIPFSNAAAMMMLNLKGTAKISKVSVSVMNGDGSQKTGLAYRGATVDMTKAPAVNTNATDYMAFLHTENATAANTITVNIAGNGLQLGEDAFAVPVSILPFDLSAGDKVLVTVYGMSDTGEEKSVTATFAPGAANVTTNSIVYLNFAPFTAEEFGQMPPKDDWKAGDVVLDDDFAWITTTTDWSGSQTGGDGGTDIGGSGSLDMTDLGGWAPSFNNKYFPYYNFLSMDNGQGDLVANQLTAKGYASSNPWGAPAGNISLWYENNGMVATAGEYMAGTFSYSLAKLNNFKGNVTVSFKACFFSDSEGYATYGNSFPVALKGSGTINGNTSVTLGSADYAPFTFYEYTLVIENADATTEIVFGSEMTGLFLDDLKIVISADSDANNLTGTEVAKAATELKYSEPTSGTTINLPATGAEEQVITFKVSGPWKATYPETVSTSNPDGTTTWMKINSVHWKASYGAAVLADNYGNLMPTAIAFSNIKDNTTGAERTATINIVSLDEATIYATFNFTQAAQ